VTPDLVAAFSGAVAAYDQLGKRGGANVKAVWSMVGLRRGNCRFQPCFEGAEGIGRQTRSDAGDAVAMASSETQELSSLDVEGEPWVLTQSSPLNLGGDTGNRTPDLLLANSRLRRCLALLSSVATQLVGLVVGWWCGRCRTFLEYGQSSSLVSWEMETVPA